MASMSQPILYFDSGNVAILWSGYLVYVHWTALAAAAILMAIAVVLVNVLARKP